MALRRPQPSLYNQRPMDEETLPLPPRTEKPSRPKSAKNYFWRLVDLIFPKPPSTVPGLDARPAEIRDSLARLLITKRGVKAGEANRIVAPWQIGSGMELRQYGAVMYLELFGSEYGWILYREVKMGVRKEKRLITRYPLHTVTISAVSVMVATIALLATLELDEDGGLMIFLAFAAIFSMIASIVCGGLQCWGTSESKLIERELRAATRQAIKLQPEPEAIGSDQRNW